MPGKKELQFNVRMSEEDFSLLEQAEKRHDLARESPKNWLPKLANH